MADRKRDARWYVYELIDPRGGETFYVGKGCGNRILAHEREAKQVLGACSEKVLKIKDIWQSCFDVERRIVAYFWDEAAAYAHEASRVDEYSLDALTNVVPGGSGGRGGAFISREPAPMDGLMAARLLTGKKNIAEAFVAWANGGRLVPTGNKLRDVISRAAFDQLFPMMWALIKESPDAKALFSRRLMQTMGVRYGGA